jgi:aryl-alcohol dehydrogenase-like predicted oxidoreductase
MEYRTFGTTSLTVSTIGLGTWPIGGARYGPSDDRDALDAIRAACDAGVTCFDTAPSYGNGHAEELLGRGLSGRRTDVVIVTKGGLAWDAMSVVTGRDSSRRNLELQIDASLRRLNSDYIDLYLIHWPDPVTPIEEVAAALEDFVRAGKTRHVGVSNFHAAQLRACAAGLGGVPLTASQVSFSLFDGRWARETFAACQMLGTGVMAYGPLAHGLLTGTFTRSTAFDPTDWRAAGTLFGQALLTPDHLERNLAVVDRLAAVAQRRGVTLPQLALAWVLAHPVVAVALVGARSPREIAEAVAASGVRLPDEVMQEIDLIMREAAGLSAVLPT